MHRPTVAVQSLRSAIAAAGTAFVMAHGRLAGPATARPA
jgi:hypothetical protein